MSKTDEIINLMTKGVKDVFDAYDYIAKVIKIKDDPDHGTGDFLEWGHVKLTLSHGVYILTGIPGSGKTTWLNNVIAHSIKAHGYRWGVFSPESMPYEEMLATMVEITTNTSMYGKYNTDITSHADIEAGMSMLAENLKLIEIEDDEALRIESIMETMQSMIEIYNTNAFAIDPYNEFSHTRDKNISETEYVSYFLQRARKFTRKNKVMLWLVAHPKKMQKNDDGEYSCPTLYDIAGSANFNNKADFGVAIRRHPYVADSPSMSSVHVLKSRKKHVAEVGEYELEFNVATSKYKVGRYEYEQ